MVSFEAFNLSIQESYDVKRVVHVLYVKTPRSDFNSSDLRFCRLRGRFSILGIWLVQLLPWLRFRVLHVDAEKNWA